MNEADVYDTTKPGATVHLGVVAQDISSYTSVEAVDSGYAQEHWAV
jgi:hypothetical protein